MIKSQFFYVIKLLTWYNLNKMEEFELNLRVKLEKMKIKIIDLYSLINRKYEFEAELKDHPLGNQDIYRLYYINYHRIGESYEPRFNNVGVIDWPYEPFMLPDGMSREDAFKVLSYLTDFIERRLNLEPCSPKSVSILDNVLNLERLGFKRVYTSLDSDFDNVIDLFTITGRLQLFKRSKHYKKYFEWYTQGITFDEVKQIYDKCGIEFYDLEDEDIVPESSKSLKKI